MQTMQQQTDNRQQTYQDLICEFAANVEECLSAGDWQNQKTLGSRVGAKQLAQVASAMRMKFTRRTCTKAEFRARLVSQILENLMTTGRYERRDEGTEAEYRLRPPGAASATPTAPSPLVDHVPSAPASTHPTCASPERATSSMDEAKPALPLGATTNGWTPLPTPVPVLVAELKPHPKQRLVPMMSWEQWVPFREHVIKHGVREPILITKDKIIIDGRSRWEAARVSCLTTIPAIIVPWDETQQQIRMIEAALRRRHLSDDQIAMAEAKLHKLTEPEIRKNRARKGGQAGGRGRGKSSDRLRDNASDNLSTEDAQQASGDENSTTPRKKVSERKQRAARKIEKVSPEMGDRVMAGEVSLLAAKRELREEGKLLPAKAPDLEPKSAEASGTETLPPPVPTPEQPSVTLRLPLESGVALADVLIPALGLDGAHQLLHDTIHVVEARKAAIADGKPAGIDSTRSQ